MRSLQLSLPVSITRQPSTLKEALERKKHLFIAGRPRRLKEGSAVIKVAIHPSRVRVIDRLRSSLGATRPEAIRTAVEQFVDKYLGNDLSLPERPVNASKGQRCDYLKVPFSPRILEAIGHQDTGTGFCARFGMTRQQVINRALDEWFARFI